MAIVLTLFVLLLAASIASWAFFQWLDARRERSSASVTVYVFAVLSLAGAAGILILAATRWPAPEVPVAAQPRAQPVSPFVVLPEPVPIEASLPAAEFAEAPAPTESATVEPPNPSKDERIRTLIDQAQRHFHVHNYARAAALGEELLTLLGEDAEVRVLVANSYYHLSRFEDADRHIEAAIGAKLSARGEPPLQWLRFQWSTATRLSNTLERARIQHALLQNFPEHRSALAGPSAELALVISPHDASPVAAPLPLTFAPPRALLSEWSTTECVTSMRSTAGGAPSMFLDNECERVVALVFASCAYATPGCNAAAMASSGWVYESDGVILTTPEQRPLMDRIAERGPLIAPTYPLREEGATRRIRYLACPVTDPEALAVLSEPALVTDERRQRLRTALERDACYARVLDLTRLGQRTRRSLDALLSNEVNSG